MVYYGSARLKQSSPHWERAVELGREVATLLGCTTWSGGWGRAPGGSRARRRPARHGRHRVSGLCHTLCSVHEQPLQTRAASTPASHPPGASDSGPCAPQAVGRA